MECHIKDNIMLRSVQCDETTKLGFSATEKVIAVLSSSYA